MLLRSKHGNCEPLWPVNVTIRHQQWSKQWQKPNLTKSNQVDNLMSFLQNLDWRFATKSFDTTKKVSAEDLETILHAIVMTPTSFGLEPYQVDIVTDQAMLDNLQLSAMNQPQVGSCSHLFVFSARTDSLDRVKEYFEAASGGSPEVREKLKGYEDMMNAAFTGKTHEEVLLWAQNQVHIALGFAMAACAELKIDSCPMGGFMPGEVKEKMELDSILTPTVLLPIGFRAEDPTRPKFRFGAANIIATRA